MNLMVTEPLLVIGAGGMSLWQALLQVYFAFGGHLTSQQASALTTLVSVLLVALARSHVVPTKSLPPGTVQAMADAKATQALNTPKG
jgi:hypothetical protein